MWSSRNNFSIAVARPRSFVADYARRSIIFHFLVNSELSKPARSSRNFRVHMQPQNILAGERSNFTIDMSWSNLQVNRRAVANYGEEWPHRLSGTSQVQYFKRYVRKISAWDTLSLCDKANRDRKLRKRRGYDGFFEFLLIFGNSSRNDFGSWMTRASTNSSFVNLIGNDRRWMANFNRINYIDERRSQRRETE